VHHPIDVDAGRDDGFRVEQLKGRSSEQIAAGHVSARQVAIEDFTLASDDALFDLVFAIRVGALDGRHPQAGKATMKRIAAATNPHARLFINGGHPLRELPIHKPT
jgi:hypothetical protein